MGGAGIKLSKEEGAKTEEKREVNHIHSAVKGKRSELLMMAILLENGFNVFQPLADVDGVDCGIFGENNSFYPIQVKSRAEFTQGDIVAVRRFKKNMFIIIYDEISKEYWIIPADDYRNMANKWLSKEGVEYYRLTKRKKNAEQLQKYQGQNGIEKLRGSISSSQSTNRA